MHGGPKRGDSGLSLEFTMNNLFDDSTDDNGELTDGERLKEQAFDRFEATRGTILLSARRALLNHLLRYGKATADDVRRAVPLPPGINPKVFGAVAPSLAKAGVIESDGHKKTERAVGHGREVKIWQIKDEPAALAWLVANPEPPTAGEGVSK